MVKLSRYTKQNIYTIIASIFFGKNAGSLLLAIDCN